MVVCVPDVDVPVTVIMYEPAGVPFGLGVPPLLLPPEPQPAANSINRANTLTGINFKTLRLRDARRVNIKIPRIANASGHRLKWSRPLGRNRGTANAREVVVMTKDAVWPACTVTAGHATPVGNPEQVKAYETAPKSVIVNVAGDPAATVLEDGEALKLEAPVGHALTRFAASIDPSPVAGS